MQTHFALRHTLTAVALLSVILLDGCGGGSGGSSSTTGTQSATPTESASTAASAASVADSGASAVASAASGASAAEPSQATVAVQTPSQATNAETQTSAKATGTTGSADTAAQSSPTAANASRVRNLSGSVTTAGAIGGDAALTSYALTSSSSGIQPQATAVASTSGVVAKVTSNVTYASSYTGTAYYVNSASGSDSNPGSTDKPWKTLRRAASAVLNRGDALLLHCDSTWTEPFSLSKAFAPSGDVLIAAYGSCSRRPLIKGGVAIAAAAWTQLSTSAAGTIYSTPMANNVTGMLLNGQPMQRARHPNATTRRSAFSVSSTGTTGSKLVVSTADKSSLAGRDLVNADIGLHSAPYMIEAAAAASYDASTGAVTLKAAPRTAISTGAGYFFEGKRWMLDAPGEWLLDTTTNSLLIMLAPGVTLSSVSLEALQAQPTMSVTGIPNVRIENIAIDGSGDDGLRVTESGASSIKGVAVTNARGTGILLSSTSGLPSAQGATVQDCIVSGSGTTGIGTSLNNSRITQNTVTETGSTVIGIMRPVAGIRLSQVPGSVVSGNDIRRSGYAGVLFGNQPSITIAGNHIEDSCLLLTDCGAIYAWGSSGSSTRSQINNNHIVRAGDPNMVGGSTSSSGGAGDLSAGVYLDEGTDNLDIVSNYIDDSFVGVNLHKAKRNFISGNLIYGVREAGIRAQSSGSDTLSVAGNRVEDNLIYAPVYFVTGPDGTPTTIGGVPQLWIHQSDAASMFNATSGNSSARNMSLHIGGISALKWILRSNGSNQNNNSVGWAKYAPSDTVGSPFLASVVGVQGTQLIANSSFAAPSEPWTSYTYTRGANIVQFGTQSNCTGNCASLTPSTVNDVLQQTGLKPSSTGPDLMFVRYRARALDKPTSAKLEVRGDASPYATAGYLEGATDIAPSGRLIREAFFARALKGDLRVSMKATVGATLAIDSIELYQVNSVQLGAPLTYGRLVVNQSSQSVSLTCVSLGISNCSTVSATGAPITWPLVLPSNAARMVFSRDPAWLQ